MNLTKANNQIRNACIAGTICGIFTLILALDSPMFFLDVLLTFGLTWGIYQKSRVCAVIMFIDFVLSRIIMWQAIIESHLSLLTVDGQVFEVGGNAQW